MQMRNEMRVRIRFLLVLIPDGTDLHSSASDDGT